MPRVLRPLERNQPSIDFVCSPSLVRNGLVGFWQCDARIGGGKVLREVFAVGSHNG